MAVLFQKKAKWLSVFGLGLLVAACGVRAPGGYGLFAYDCPEKAADLVADTDWNKAETITISVRHDEYDPMVVPLRKGRAYVMRIENKDEYNHRFHAPEFFRAVALGGVSVDGAENAAGACISGLGLPAGKVLTARLVTVSDGHYRFEESGLTTTFLGASFGAIVIE